jgi:hypothetical protein
MEKQQPLLRTDAERGASGCRGGSFHRLCGASLFAVGGAAEADGAPGAGGVRSSGEYPRWTQAIEGRRADGDGG